MSEFQGHSGKDALVPAISFPEPRGNRSLPNQASNVMAHLHVSLLRMFGCVWMFVLIYAWGAAGVYLFLIVLAR
jgi:hypothetical protein